MSVICHAKPSTERFIVELEQNAYFTNESISIRSAYHTLLDNLSAVYKRQRTDSYEVKTPLIESISWQSFYATNLLVAYELILTPRDTRPGSHHCSWIPIEVVIAIGQLLKNYWNPDLPLFNPAGQQESSENHTFAITTALPDARNDQQQGQPSESSDQQSRQVPPHPIGYSNHLLYSDSGDGNEGPQQYSHTMGLNCFVLPCHGVCQFRQSCDSSGSGALNSVASSADSTGATAEPGSCPYLTSRHCYSCNSVAGVASYSMATGAVDLTPPAGQANCNVVVFSEGGQIRQCGKVCKNEKALSSHKRNYHCGQQICNLTLVSEDGQQQQCGKVCKTVKALSNHKYKKHSGQKTCEVKMVGEDGQQRSCARIFRNAESLSNHKCKKHSGLKTCEVKMVGEDGQQQSCGTIFRNAQSLSNHKRIVHGGQKICDWKVLGENGKLRPCGQVCNNVLNLSNHKRKAHSGQKICDVTVLGKDSQQRPCGKVLKNAGSLSTHKSLIHSGYRTCDVKVAEEDGIQRLCGSICSNTRALLSHKSKVHSGQKTCNVVINGKDGQRRRCGMTCKNHSVLWDHKRRDHFGQKTCSMTVTGKDGQQGPSGKVCKNAIDLSNHKRTHRKRKPVDVN
ncbi:hypothetical protein [Endozoicomonas sp. 8E]|uniref:hypothetical protein n=1 Tax=Endozoicomonas sp. 8E TaxID=3035692 RepID=UPI00293923BA|nr:hypothetical protein [Endozoicomonas sp. 8E]WOG26943.1 hypothetical protein P6910_20695 [Endozoicomonas sp. 8E]